MPADLSGVKNKDTVIVYTHGQYTIDKSSNLATATNRVFWSGKAVSAVTCARYLRKKAKLPKDTEYLTLIVHACFSAGTIENPPTQINNANTFAGQLCSSMGRNFPNINVVGYQGKAKAGLAGFPASAEDGQSQRELRRRSVVATNNNNNNTSAAGTASTATNNNADNNINAVTTGTGGTAATPDNSGDRWKVVYTWDGSQVNLADEGQGDLVHWS